MWQCSHCIFDSLNHHTCKDIATLEHFLRLPLVVSLADLASTVPESVSCTSQDCRVVNKSVQDLISLLIFSDSLWLHLGVCTVLCYRVREETGEAKSPPTSHRRGRARTPSRCSPGHGARRRRPPALPSTKAPRTSMYFSASPATWKDLYLANWWLPSKSTRSTRSSLVPAGAGVRVSAEGPLPPGVGGGNWGPFSRGV